MTDWFASIVWIAAGSALGGSARFFVSGLIARAVGETFPWGTMVVNVTGCLAIGIVAAAAGHHLLDGLPFAWPLAVTGFLGSYTTVSSFSLQTLALIRDGASRRATGNIVLSLGLCLAAVAIGFTATTAILPATTA